MRISVDPEDSHKSDLPSWRDIKPPNDRHYPHRIRLNSPPKAKTTIIVPGTDIAGDMAAIRAGLATMANNTFIVNGRTYGRKGSGTLYPISGDGFIGPVGRSVFKALIAYRRYNGINDLAEFEISKQPFISDEARATAQRIWRMREEARSDPDSSN
jgi:hypothetical protein